MVRGQKLGLSIKSYQNRVLVTSIAEGSRAEGNIQPLDHIIDVEGMPVTDKAVANDMIVRALKVSTY